MSLKASGSVLIGLQEDDYAWRGKKKQGDETAEELTRKITCELAPLAYDPIRPPRKSPLHPPCKKRRICACDCKGLEWGEVRGV